MKRTIKNQDLYSDFRTEREKQEDEEINLKKKLCKKLKR